MGRTPKLQPPGMENTSGSKPSQQGADKIIGRPQLAGQIMGNHYRIMPRGSISTVFLLIRRTWAPK